MIEVNPIKKDKVLGTHGKREDAKGVPKKGYLVHIVGNVEKRDTWQSPVSR